MIKLDNISSETIKVVEVKKREQMEYYVNNATNSKTWMPTTTMDNTTMAKDQHFVNWTITHTIVVPCDFFFILLRVC